MVKSITVFIRTKWIVKPFSSSSSAWLYGGWPPEDKIEKELSREDALMLKNTKEVAEELGLSFDVRDLGTPRGWISAVISKVKSTPTVMIDECRVEGVVSKDDILRIIKNKISEAS
jgi:signal recognition particle subunit SEC65